MTSVDEDFSPVTPIALRRGGDPHDIKSVETFYNLINAFNQSVEY